jgi:hypothetical protein
MLRKNWTLLLGALLALGSGGLLVGCGDDDGGGAVCGNGVLEGQETCDGSDFGGATCEDFGFTGGTLACDDNCLIDDSGCTSDLCGNGVLDAGEECEGDDLGGETCEGLGFASGTLACADDCTFDTAACEGGCGNGELEVGEECDGTDFGAQTCADAGFGGGDLLCSEDCTLDYSECTDGCGNGVQESGEECDGDDLAGQSCQDIGFDGGTLACAEDCTYDTSACEGGLSTVGGACVENADCASANCIPEVGGGMPGGYCIDACLQDGTCDDPDALCVSSGMQQFCARWCDPNGTGTECRPGYGCIAVGESGDGVCWAACDDDAQCTTTNDCDTDPESDSYGFCLTPDEICDNDVDDDFDDLVDCADPDCNAECPSGEICDNTTDDDGDGLVDCDDAECYQHVNCTGIACTPHGALACDDNLTGESNDQTGSTNTIVDYCGAGQDNWTGPEYTYELSVTENTIITITLSNLSADVDMIVLRDDGTQGCNPLECFVYSMEIQPDNPTEEVNFEAQPGYTYYVVIDGWDTAVATYDVAVVCDQGEICDNTTDDDGDGLVDCDDPSCFGQGPCTTETNCGDGYDNDDDGNTDCEDDDCLGVIAEVCTDGVDNDCDGDADCADSDCTSDPYCTATSILTEDFSTWPPADWTIEDGSSDGNTWMQCDPNNGCTRELPGHDGPFALCDSDGAGQGVTLEESLTSPVMDLSTYSNVYVSFFHKFFQFGTADDSDFGYVEVSTDGTNWTPVATYGDDDESYVLLDLSTELGGQASAQVRFRYVDAGTWAWYWTVDTFEVRAGN